MCLSNWTCILKTTHLNKTQLQDQVNLPASSSDYSVMLRIIAWSRKAVITVLQVFDITRSGVEHQSTASRVGNVTMQKYSLKYWKFPNKSLLPNSISDHIQSQTPLTQISQWYYSSINPNTTTIVSDNLICSWSPM